MVWAAVEIAPNGYFFAHMLSMLELLAFVPVDVPSRISVAVTSKSMTAKVNIRGRVKHPSSARTEWAGEGTQVTAELPSSNQTLIVGLEVMLAGRPNESCRLVFEVQQEGKIVWNSETTCQLGADGSAFRGVELTVGTRPPSQTEERVAAEAPPFVMPVQPRPVAAPPPTTVSSPWIGGPPATSTEIHDEGPQLRDLSGPTSEIQSRRVENDWSSGGLGGVTFGWLTLSAVAVFYFLVRLTSAPIEERTLQFSVLLAGGAGGSIQSLQSLVVFLGNRSYQRAWTPYYVLRPALGAATAFVCYIVLRAAFTGSSVEAARLNYYGILGLSFAAGLFSRALVARVSLLIEVAFATAEGRDALREATLTPGKPIKTLDRYHGFLIYRIADDRRSVEVLLQSTQPESGSSIEIDIGDGERQSRTAEFRVVVHSLTATCDVEPKERILRVKAAQSSTETVRFALRCSSSEIDPDSLIEVTNTGRIVALVPLRAREAGSRANEHRATLSADATARSKHAEW